MPEITPKAVYSREDVRRLLDLSERQLRGWEKHRLIPAMERFAFSDLIALRTLTKLCEDRIPPAKIRNVLSAVRERLHDITDPLKQLRLVSDGRRIHVQVGEHAMEPISGQLLLNFNEAELKRLVAFRIERRPMKAAVVVSRPKNGFNAVWSANKPAPCRMRSKRTKARWIWIPARRAHG